MSSLALTVVMTLSLTIPAQAIVRPVSSTSSLTHPGETTWYQDDSPTIEWNTRSDVMSLIGSLGTPGYAGDVAVDGDIALIADASSGVRVIDISDPTDPMELGSLPFSGYSYATGVAIFDDYAYVTDGANDPTAGLLVVDISDSAAPSEVTSVPLSSLPSDIEVDGDYAYVASEGEGLLIFDISTPSSPSLLGAPPSIAEGIPEADQVIGIEGDCVYVTDLMGLRVVDVSDKSAPTVVATLQLPEVFGGTVVGDLAYLAGGDNGLRIIDVSDPLIPVEVGDYDTPAYSSDVVVRGDIAYVLGVKDPGEDENPVDPEHLGIQAIDITDPTAPILLASCVFDTRVGGSLVAAGGILYAVDGNALRIVEAEEVATPAVLGTYPATHRSYQVKADGDTVYVAGGGDGLVALDFSDPSAPALLGTYDSPGYARALDVGSGIAYVLDDDDDGEEEAPVPPEAVGLKVVDISDPTNPVLLGECALPPYASDADVEGDYLYVANAVYGLKVVDVSNPAGPEVITTFDAVSPQSVCVDGSVAYLALGSNGIASVDVSDPGSPVVLGSHETAGYVSDITIDGDVLYVAEGTDLIATFDVSTPSDPQLLGGFQAVGRVRAIEVVGDTAYASGSGFLEFLDVSDTANLVSMGAHGLSSGWGADLAISEGIAIVANGSGTLAVDITESHTLTRASEVITSGDTAVTVVGDVAYLAMSSGRMVSLDLTDPAQPAVLASLDTTGVPRQVAVAGDTAYVAATGDGLVAVDVSDPGSLQVIGAADTAGSAYGVTVSGDVAYLADGVAESTGGDDRGGLKTFDISDASHPVQVGWCETGGNATRVFVSGDEAYVAIGSEGLATVDISDPSNPVLLGTCDTPGIADDVAVSGDMAFVADRGGGLCVIDVSDPASPIIAGTYDLAESVDHIRVDGNMVYVVGRGIHAVDVTDPVNPALIHTYDVTSPANDVEIAGTFAVAVTSRGVQSVYIADGPVGYSYELDQAADTKPDAMIDKLVPSASFSGLADGEWFFHVRAVAEGGRAGVTTDRTVLIGAAPEVEFMEVAGTNRYDTAIRASERGFETADTVVIATGVDWPDALGGAALAGQVGGPLLLTRPDVLPPGVFAEIERLGATSAYILGGTSAVSEAVKNALEESLTAGVTRIWGSDRYMTANNVADEVIRLAGDGFEGAAFVSRGDAFPDALGASPLAASQGMPILLVREDAAPHLPSAVDSVVILGGTGAISGTTGAALETALGEGAVDRIGGATRYETAAQVADYGIAMGMRWNGVGITTGLDFPDGMSGGVMLGSMDSVMLLTAPTVLAPAVEQRLRDNRGTIGTVHLLGGTDAVSETVRERVSSVLR